MSEYRFFGRERVTVEVDGWFEAGQLEHPSSLELELDARGRARVQLFCFAVEDLRITGVPLVRASYAEILWRIAVRDRSWWVVACDLEDAGPRLLARRFVRYPVRRARVRVTEREVVSDAGLAIEIGGPTGAQRAAEQRTLLVGDEAQWTVPWGDDSPVGGIAPIRVTDDRIARTTLGATVAWSDTALVRAGREHRCGVARRRS